MSEENKEKVVINMDDGSQTVEILHGQAPEPLNENSVEIEGNISAPGDFYEKRKGVINKDHAYVRASYKNREIGLYINPHVRRIQQMVHGRIKMDHRLERFKINTDTRYSRDDLALLCKFNRALFHPVSDGMNLVKKLNDFHLEYNQKMEDSKDNRGNRKSLVERSIEETGLPTEFTLSVPIFEGGETSIVPVDLLFEVAGSGDVVFWLESPDLEQEMEEQARELIDAEIEKLNDLVIIYS